jgi:hypothetical protein
MMSRQSSADNLPAGPPTRSVGRAARRRRAVQLGFGLLGLTCLTGTVVLIRDQPWVEKGLIFVIGWQLAWYVVRAIVMLSIWNREPELSNREKWWIAITVPIGILFAIWLGRGRLSQWIAAEEAREIEESDVRS